MKNTFFKISIIIKKNLSEISLIILSFFIAFICGNFFGIYSKRIFAPFIFIFLTIILLETINFLKFSIEIKFSKISYFFRIANSIKRGFLIGIFIEAFKVGS